MNLFKATILILFAFFALQLKAQTKTVETQEKLSLDSGSIENQFNYINKASTNWTNSNGQHFKVIKIKSLEKLKNNTLDSLTVISKKLNDTKNIVLEQKKEISKLKNNLGDTQKKLEQNNTEKDSMSFFGILLSKRSYSTLMLFIIIGLIALALFLYSKFKQSNTITKKAKLSLIEVENEFQEHRKVALEREQKVRRQLQDEIIKNKKS